MISIPIFEVRERERSVCWCPAQFSLPPSQSLTQSPCFSLLFFTLLYFYLVVVVVRTRQSVRSVEKTAAATYSGCRLPGGLEEGESTTAEKDDDDDVGDSG